LKTPSTSIPVLGVCERSKGWTLFMLRSVKRDFHSAGMQTIVIEVSMNKERGFSYHSRMFEATLLWACVVGVAASELFDTLGC